MYIASSNWQVFPSFIFLFPFYLPTYLLTLDQVIKDSLHIGSTSYRQFVNFPPEELDLPFPPLSHHDVSPLRLLCCWSFLFLLLQQLKKERKMRRRFQSLSSGRNPRDYNDLDRNNCRCVCEKTRVDQSAFSSLGWWIGEISLRSACNLPIYITRAVQSNQLLYYCDHDKLTGH